MTLSKAMEILQQQVRLTSPNLEPDLIDALRLGIHALFRQSNRYYLTFPHMREPLPGETSEDEPP